MIGAPVHDFPPHQIRLKVVHAVHVLGGEAGPSIKECKVGLFQQHPLRPLAPGHFVTELPFDGPIGKPQKVPGTVVRIKGSSLFVASIAQLVADPDFRVGKVYQVWIGNSRMCSHSYAVGRPRAIVVFGGSSRLAL